MLYIANSHAVVHSTHASNLVKSEGGLLHCSGCSGVVGRSGASSCALYFDCLTDGRGLWSQFSRVKRLARDVVDRASSSGELRFCSAPGNLLLVVVNTDTTLGTASGGRAEPVVKLRFSEAGTQAGETEDELGPIAALDWSVEDALLVWEELRRNQKFLPPSMRALNMSFLNL